jgi:hypothetical protein
MEEERIPKKVLNGTFDNTRPVGRPRTRWADVVQKHALQLLGVRGWRRAEDRDEWRHALREARPGRGCSAIHGMLSGPRKTKFVAQDTSKPCIIFHNWYKEQLYTPCFSF